MTWLYWKLHKHRDGKLWFTRVMVGGVQKRMEHQYIDPTGSKPSEMLMVWPHTPAERAAQIVDGVYELEAQQLHDLQHWCAALRPPLHMHGPRRADAHRGQLGDHAGGIRRRRRQRR